MQFSDIDYNHNAVHIITIFFQNLQPPNENSVPIKQ